MGHYSHLTMLITAGLCFHALFWARNAAFLWSRWRVIAGVIVLAELWQIISNPIGGAWGAWSFNPDRVLGIWIFHVMPIEDVLGIAVVSSAAACGVLVFGYSPRRSLERGLREPRRMVFSGVNQYVGTESQTIVQGARR